jgi:small subunit ribosomal protein S20
MPHLESARKRLRQANARNQRNRATVKDLKTQVKKFLRAVKDGKKDVANAELNATFSKLDKCGMRGYIHKNAVARHKSRLTARLQKIGAPKPAGN